MPPDDTRSVPPLNTVVDTALAVDMTDTTPPFDTVVDVTLPPPEMSSVAPLTTVPRALPPLNTVWRAPESMLARWPDRRPSRSRRG